MRTRLHRALLTAALTISTSAVGHAQNSTELTISPGTEIRITQWAAAPTIRGRVVVLAGDTIVLRDDAGTMRAALRDISVLEVRGGEDKRRGFLIGAGIAGGITAIFGGIDASKGEITNDDLIGTLILNALIGGLVGYAFAPKGWERIPLPTTDR